MAEVYGHSSVNQFVVAAINNGIRPDRLKTKLIQGKTYTILVPLSYMRISSSAESEKTSLMSLLLENVALEGTG
jgi:hypothetical protein